MKSQFMNLIAMIALFFVTNAANALTPMRQQSQPEIANCWLES